MRGHSRPQLVTTLTSRFVEDVTVGSEHTLALTSDGEVWGWGCNGYGQLGLGHTGTVREPQLLTALNTANIKQVRRTQTLCLVS